MIKKRKRFRKANKRNSFRRTARESIILSATAHASARTTEFFERGRASALLSSAAATDKLFTDKVTSKVSERFSLRRNVTMPLRNAVARAFSGNRFFSALAFLRERFLCASVRSLGIFFITFGIYAAALFMLKRYVVLPLPQSGTGELAVSAICLVSGLLCAMFGERSLLSALAGGRIIGSMLYGCLGVNDSSLERRSKPETDIGGAFLLGSVCGVGTLFFGTGRVLAVLLFAVVAVVTLNIPEFGMLAGVAGSLVLPAGYTAAVMFVSVVSYLFKCLRLKRNLHFGLADIAALAAFAAAAVGCAVSGGISRTEAYALCMAGVYFLAKNLICTETLLMQSFGAIRLSVSLGCAAYLLGEFSDIIPLEGLRAAAAALSSARPEAEVLAFAVPAAIPFALCRFGRENRRGRLAFLLLAVVSALVTGFSAFYFMLAVSVFVYIAAAYKAPVGALAGAAVVLPVVGFVVCRNFASPFYLRPAGVSFWVSLAECGGAVLAVLFAAVLLLMFQRIFGCMAMNSSAYVISVCGASAASAAVLALGCFALHPLCDIRSLAASMFVFGMQGAVYGIYSKPQYTKGEIH